MLSQLPRNQSRFMSPWNSGIFFIVPSKSATRDTMIYIGGCFKYLLRGQGVTHTAHPPTFTHADDPSRWPLIAKNGQLVLKIERNLVCTRDITMDPLALFLLGAVAGILVLVLVQFLICRAYWRTFELKKPLEPKPPAVVTPHPVNTSSPSTIN